MSKIRWLDLLVIVAYVGMMAAIGIRFARRQMSTERYYVAKRSVPAWAMGLSLLATIISSVTFVAYPGSGFLGDWSLLIPGLMIVFVLALLGAVIIPFFREAVRMSAYEYFGQRFGYASRVYASVAFAAGLFSKMAFVFYLLALTVSSMTAWNVDWLIVAVGAITVFYTFIGGIEAVIWADVRQGFVLWIGIIVALSYVVLLTPGGVGHIFSVAAANHKFNFGSSTLNLSKPTIVVLALYGFFFYLQKYTADQTVVQRYLVAKTDKDALKGITLGAVLCIPVWALFMLIGTALWSFYNITGERLPWFITKPDQIFPHFLMTHVPTGLAGLFLASLFGAAMANLSSDLNSISLVAIEDYYRVLRPESSDRERLRTGKLVVVACGILAVSFAIRLAHMQGTALGLWYTVSAIVAGGLAGLFLLAFFSVRANRIGASSGVIANVVFTAWATLTANHGNIVDLGRLNFPFHGYMIGVIGNIVVLVCGYAVSLLFGDRGSHIRELTIWGWIERRKYVSSNTSPRSSDTLLR